MRLIGLAVVLGLAGCAAMAPPAAGPWPPLPAQERAAPPAPATRAAGPPAPTLLPAPATVEPNAAPPTTAPAPAPRPAPTALFSLPEGWRTPSDAELDGPMLIRRGDSASLYLTATGDFNADGAIDRAALLVSDARDQYGVFIFDGRPEAYPVLFGGPLAGVGSYGVEATDAGPLRFFLFGSSRFLIRWDGAAYAVSVESD